MNTLSDDNDDDWRRQQRQRNDEIVCYNIEYNACGSYYGMASASLGALSAFFITFCLLLILRAVVVVVVVSRYIFHSLCLAYPYIVVVV